MDRGTAVVITAFTGGLIALQAAIGGIQWALELPALLVWVHIAVAIATWLTMLWTVAAAGRLEPRPEPATSGSSVKAASCRVIRIASAARSTSPP